MEYIKFILAVLAFPVIVILGVLAFLFLFVGPVSFIILHLPYFIIGVVIFFLSFFTIGFAIEKRISNRARQERLRQIRERRKMSQQ